MSQHGLNFLELSPQLINRDPSSQFTTASPVGSERVASQLLIKQLAENNWSNVNMSVRPSSGGWKPTQRPSVRPVPGRETKLESSYSGPVNRAESRRIKNKGKQRKKDLNGQIKFAIRTNERTKTKSPFKRLVI